MQWIVLSSVDFITILYGGRCVGVIGGEGVKLVGITGSMVTLQVSFTITTYRKKLVNITTYHKKLVNITTYRKKFVNITTYRKKLVNITTYRKKLVKKTLKFSDFEKFQIILTEDSCFIIISG